MKAAKAEIILDREIALRIALAARIIPDVDLAQLLDVLDDSLGSPLTIDKLSRITVTDLKTGLGSLDGEEDGLATLTNLAMNHRFL